MKFSRVKFFGFQVDFSRRDMFVRSAEKACIFFRSEVFNESDLSSIGYTVVL